MQSVNMNKIRVFLLVLLTFIVASTFRASNVSAQTCAAQRTINQWACLSIPLTAAECAQFGAAYPCWNRWSCEVQNQNVDCTSASNGCHTVDPVYSCTDSGGLINTWCNISPSGNFPQCYILGGGETCSIDGGSSSCQGKPIGSSCGSNGTCEDNGNTGSDGNPRCTCNTGGGGGTPTPTPTPTGTLQGRKGIVSWGASHFIQVDPAISTQTTLSTGTTNTSNPFFFPGLVLNGETHTFSTAGITGYKSSFSRCYDNNTCHDDANIATAFSKFAVNGYDRAAAFVSETSILNNYNNPPNPYPYADFYWHYIPVPNCTVTASKATAQPNETIQITVNSNIANVDPVIVDNQVQAGYSHTQAFESQLGATKDCNDAGSCSTTVPFTPSVNGGFTVGQTAYLYCRGSNGPFGTALQAGAGGTLYECNPFNATNPLGDRQNITCGSGSYVSIPIVAAPPWWQVSGDVISGGGIDSKLPSGSVFNIVSGTNISPGLPILNGAGTFGSGSVSSKGWIAANTGESYPGVYTYDSLRAKLPADLTMNIAPASMVESTFNSGSTYEGYKWYQTNGSASLTDLDNVVDIGSKKVIVFVNGDLTINSQVTFNEANGFVMFIVKGTTTISASIANATAGTPELKGIYVTNMFQTNTAGSGADQQLHLRGSVIANNIVTLRRSLATTASPAEYFQYSPGMAMNIPSQLLIRRLSWKEVAP